MKKFLLTLAISLQAIALAATTIDDFETMKTKLGEKSLPIVNLTVDIATVSKPNYTNATIEIADPLRRTDGENMVTTISCKVKYRGNTSLRYDKKSFNVKLLNEKGKSLDMAMFGMRKDDAWILDAMAIDRVRMRNRLNFDTWNAMSRTPYDTDYDRRNGTQGLFVELFINGKYHGLYCFTDKINRKLLGIKKAETGADGSTTIKGVLYKGDQWSDATRLNGYYEQDMNGASWNEWELDYPDDYPCTEAYTPLKNFIDYCVHSSDADFEEGIDENFYFDNFRDYQVFVLSQGLRDNLMKNAFLSIVNINKGHCMMITPWDLDCSLGGEWDGTYHSDVATLNELQSVGLYKRLWNDNVRNFQVAVADRWRILNKEVLSEESFCQRVDSFANAFKESGAWEREYEMWNGNPVELKKNLDDETDYIKSWYHSNRQNLKNVMFHDIASGIDNVKSKYTDGKRQYTYNVCGQRVGNDYKGIVIENGHKSVRK